MMEEKESFWQNKVITGKGTLRQFSEAYELVNGAKGQFATASQLFQTQEQSQDKEHIYEFLIYYKVNPATIKGIPKDTEQEKPQELVI